MSSPTDPFNELRKQLERAHTTAPDRSTSDGRHPRSRRWRPSRFGAFALAAVLVTGTAVAATTPWNPTIGGNHGAESPTLARGDVPAAQTAALGVLRRAQTETDRNPAVLKALRTVSERLGSGLHVDGIRLLREHPGESVLLLPFRRVGSAEDPSHQLHDGLCVYTAYTHADTAPPRTVASGQPGTAPIPVPTLISGSFCGTLTDVQRGRVRSEVSGLVPDGVARVRVPLATGQVVTVDVTDNYYESPIEVPPTGPSRTMDPADPTWLDAEGRTVPEAR